MNNIMLNRKQGNVTLGKQEAGLNKHPFSKLIGLSMAVTVADFHNINNVNLYVNHNVNISEILIISLIKLTLCV